MTKIIELSFDVIVLEAKLAWNAVQLFWYS